MITLKYLIAAVIFLVTLEQVTPANILVIAFFSTKSHKLTYMPLIEELGKRGHNITVVTPVKQQKETKNVKEIYTTDVEKLMGQNFDIFEMKDKGTTMDPAKIFGLAYASCEESLDLPHVRALLHEKFDLAFVQPLFNDCVLAFIYRLQIPFVLFSPAEVHPNLIDPIGGHFPPSITPNIFLGYSSEMTFLQRMANYGVNMLMQMYQEFVYTPNIAKIYRSKLGQDIPSVRELMGNTSLILGNGHFSLTGVKPYYPDVVDVGGTHTRPGKPIPKELEDFIQKGKDGFIFFSMGSAIKGDMMPEPKRKMILKVFSKLKQQVLWKWESETMPGLPENVKLSKWLPQQDLLGHKDIKMFITHCGGGSTQESIYHGVPTIGLPMMADQPANSKLAKNKGMLIELDWNKMSEADFEGAIRAILDNPKYRNNAKQVSSLFRDRPVHPLDLGVYWVEYVLRHNGARHLRNAGRKLNYFQYHSFDVIGAYLAIIVSIVYLVWVILRWTCRKIFCRKSLQSKATTGKKNN